MEIQDKVHVLVEALPYIQKFKGKTFVIKYGGNVMIDEDIRDSIIQDIALLKHIGINPIVVHGGGPEIDKEVQKANIPPEFVDGLRITDKKTMSVIRSVSKQISSDIKARFKEQNCLATNITDDLLTTKQLNQKLGLVGKILRVNKAKINDAIKKGQIPLISPIGSDGKDYHNINADTVATKIAEEIKAEKLTILTNVEGVYEDGELISHLSINDAITKINKGVISRGMIPKVKACVHAINKGVKKAHFIDGTLKHSLFLEIFTDEGVGTEIVKNGSK